MGTQILDEFFGSHFQIISELQKVLQKYYKKVLYAPPAPSLPEC